MKAFQTNFSAFAVGCLAVGRAYGMDGMRFGRYRKPLEGIRRYRKVKKNFLVVNEAVTIIGLSADEAGNGGQNSVGNRRSKFNTSLGVRSVTDANGRYRSVKKFFGMDGEDRSQESENEPRGMRGMRKGEGCDGGFDGGWSLSLSRQGWGKLIF
ncbi:hypothetical protein Cflav_PD3574 [Pedosphaera parvula Ellin514]|uniref:Uncharacterized protein n=1 Tax=Pedosphaera parvula (strain Ellin514) TaxID=320771 RepID=B9XH81_PEDPL|nr:hypothetical protein Cflav_PD3574 [Pedosphaera parvula Ellin514]